MCSRTNRLVVAAAAATVASGALFAQPELELFATTDAQVELVQQITELRAAGGPTPEGTIEPLRALALQYQEAGNDALAIAVLEEARYVTRIHRGLASAEEALLLRQQIRSEKALGDHERVWDLEQDMVTIARQHHDDIRMMPIFRELAEDRSDALRQYRAGHLPPEVYLGCYYVPGPRRYDDTRGETRPPLGPDSGSCRAGQSSVVAGQFRWEILLYYADAIEVIVKNGDYASQELRDLEREAFRISTFPALFPVSANVGSVGSSARPRAPRCSGETLDELLASELLGSCLEPLIRGNGGVIANVGGWASLARLIAYEMRSGAPATDRANAIAELADWYLFSTRAERRQFHYGSKRAIEVYERAYRELRQDDQARAAIFSPDVPVTFAQPPPLGAGFPLGSYTPAPDVFASTATAESSRYIDVSFDITKYGRGEQIEILETSKGATRAERRDVIRLIEGFSFRPRFVDGKVADSAPVVVRYNLSQ
jgi:hypothetical protein